MDFLKEKISKEFSEYKDTYFNIFGSYYREGDYLYTHDDCVAGREIAFILYLNDCKSGNLVIYENDYKTVHLKIKPKRNRLAYFKVSDVSFHEVEKVLDVKRQAITGWLNVKGKINESRDLKNDNMKVPDDLIYIDLPIPKEILTNLNHQENKYFSMCLGQFELEEESIEKSGPFIKRRISKINLKSTPFAPSIESFNLIKYEYIKMEPNDYILVNDDINDKTDNILDVFIFMDDYDNLIKVHDSDISYISAEQFTLLYGLRNGKVFSINNINKEVKFIHMIYELK
ncbi:OGFD1 [Hepatospora eriocheir]|uniref:OGFD1 n=1 Tax=Hepatospora eriocheir TaxID=1081669 RepID=A0A1X0Q8Z8_9MICR|nr:OGFD1 [Hepatospora eriocheir]